MVRNIFLAFIGLVGLYFILRYPGDVISLLQMFVDGAQKMASSLSHLNLGGGAKTASTVTTG